MASYCGLALSSACRRAALATHLVLASALPQPVALRASSCWAPAARIVEYPIYLEGRLPEKGSETRGWRNTRWLASGHGEKVVPLQHLWCIAAGQNGIPQLRWRRRVRERVVR